MAFSDLIRNAVNAFLVKQYMADGLEQVEEDVAAANSTANNANNRVDQIITTQDGQTPVQVVDAKHSNVTQRDFSSIGARMDDHDTTLAEKANYDYVNALISNMTDGSPKELFYSIDALNTKYPTGAIGPMLVFDSTYTDGAHSMFWDETQTQWIDAGLYQGVGIADGTVTPQKTSFFTLSKNLFDLNTITNGYYVNASGGGDLRVNAAFAASDYIPVLPNTQYTLTYGNQTSFYNSNKSCITPGYTGNSSPATITTPANCYYIRVSVQTQGLSSMQVEQGSSATTYVEGGYRFNTNSIKNGSVPISKLSGIVYTPSQPLVVFDDKITIDYINNKVIFPSFYLLKNQQPWKHIQPSDFSLSEFSESIVTIGQVWTVYIDTVKAFNSQNPFTTVKSAWYYGGDTDNNIVIATISSNGKTSTDFPYTEITIATKTFNDTIDRLVLPPKMFFVQGKTLPLYKSSIFSNPSFLDNIRTTLINVDASNNPTYQYFYEDIQLDDSKLQNTFKIGLKQNYNADYNYYQYITKVSMPQSNGNGKTPKICCIGDSLTEGGVPDLLKTKLTQYGATATLIGTYGGTHEGRGGWSVENFIGKNNSGITFSFSGLTTTKMQNPFMKLATDIDKTNYPQYCFRNTGVSSELSYQDDTDKTGDFYIFDFANYLSGHGLQNPDIISIALGTNDLWTANVDITYARQCLIFMIEQIKSALPNVRLGVIPQPASGSNAIGNNLWYVNYTRWIDAVMLDITSLQSTYNNLDIIPIWCHMNRDWNWDYDTTANLSSTSTIQKGHRAEYVHFNTIGRNEYCNAMSAWVMNII